MSKWWYVGFKIIAYSKFQNAGWHARNKKAKQHKITYTNSWNAGGGPKDMHTLEYFIFRTTCGFIDCDQSCSRMDNKTTDGELIDFRYVSHYRLMDFDD